MYIKKVLYVCSLQRQGRKMVLIIPLLISQALAVSTTKLAGGFFIGLKMKKAYKSKDKEHRIAIINHLIKEGGTVIYTTYIYGQPDNYYCIDEVGLIIFSKDLPIGYLESFLNENEAIHWWIRLANAEKNIFTKKHFPKKHYKGLEIKDLVIIYEKEAIIAVDAKTPEQALSEFFDMIEKAFYIDKMINWLSKLLTKNNKK